MQLHEQSSSVRCLERRTEVWMLYLSYCLQFALHGPARMPHPQRRPCPLAVGYLQSGLPRGNVLERETFSILDGRLCIELCVKRVNAVPLNSPNNAGPSSNAARCWREQWAIWQREDTACSRLLFWHNHHAARCVGMREALEEKSDEESVWYTLE